MPPTKSLSAHRKFFRNNYKNFFFLIASAFSLFALLINLGLKPPSEDSSSRFFKINKGDAFQEIVDRLKNENLIRSALAFKIFAFATGESRQIKPGFYELSPNLNGNEVISLLVRGGEKVEVVIPEGLSVSEVDKILSGKKIILPGELVDFSKDNLIEGRLFPNTYKFFTGSRTEDVIGIFLKNFDENIKTVLEKDRDNFESNLTLASLVQEEVRDLEDQKIVAGIIEKRLAAGMPLQIDATICYIKKQLLPNNPNCYPITRLDLKIDSPYNTYQHRGLPPGPIASPGVSAVQATLDKSSSPYWFYINDPKTGKTLFSKTLEEHNEKVSLYLRK